MASKKKLERVYIHDRANGVKGNFAVCKKSGQYFAYWNGEAWSTTAKMYSYKEAKRIVKRFRPTEVNVALEEFAAKVRELIEPLKILHHKDGDVPGGVTEQEIINLLTNELKDKLYES